MKDKKTYKHLIPDSINIFQNHSLLFIKSGVDGCSLSIDTKRSKGKLTIDTNKRGILVIEPAMLTINQGSLKYTQFDFNRLVKLQAFLDEANNKDIKTEKSINWKYLPASLNEDLIDKDIENWFFNQYFFNRKNIDMFSAVLRSNENYRLIKFLLSQYFYDPNNKLQEICVRYGLSISHFRRLSLLALGNAPKSELQSWRLVNALLELINKENNFTTIAMNHGYASLSHFSNNMKNEYGISPRELKKILR